jgi:osmoprotectant transport system permease protein
MNLIQQAFIWLNDPLNWTNPDGILARTGEHLTFCGLAVLLGLIIAWPIGIWLGHIRRGGGFVVAVANVTRGIPTVSLLTILPLTFIGEGTLPIVLALAVFAIPPLLANAYLGLREVDPDVTDAARGMGMSGWQVIRRVELPLAVPYLAAGLRTAVVQVLATGTLATLVSGGGLGAIISLGFGLGIAAGGGEIIGGGLVVIALCLLAEGLLAVLQWAVTPRPLRRGGRRPPSSAADAALPGSAAEAALPDRG